ncbi:hypothetical protein LJ655_04155 [Paraburkholderia sp. MMS20-SJTN17]|uniref:Glycoside hydrolase family 5 domain-containing protein n=1 Tax=Paraburkholderia translucens TaxID=2886945 RepID=A0ABS8K8P6_9BURK|nr:hypothetical protein [Paraburkholderia sp. MMS20-SJTN17]MCC8401094.1 hypothetical protein [Paraburkholderia sp. MMS20-SJTN17]
MIKRRQFLSGLTALSASYLLPACGGGGSGNASNKASGAADASGASGTAAASGASGSSATASSTKDTTTPVANDANGTSPDGTTLPASPYIIDKTGAKWTLSNGVIYCNGATVGDTYNVSLVLWYGGKIWHCGTGGQYYVIAGVANRWLPCNDPRIAITPPAGMFYGMNGHYDYTYTPQQIVSILKAMGCTSYRIGVTDNSTQLNAAIGLAQAFQAAGMTLVVLIDQGVTDSNGNLWNGESAAYTEGYVVAQAVANALKPYGVTIYECGNELTRQNATVLDFTTAGTSAADFNNANWPVMRGLMRGMIDGVKSVQANAKCGINFCVNDIGAADALWDGMQPDGSGGYPTVRWDITTWHNYEVYGDVFSLGVDGAMPGFDLPTYCKARYGVPFIITEWNTGPEQTETYRASYITSKLGEFYRNRKTHNIQAVMYYVLDSGNGTYGIMIDGAPCNPSYSSFASFTAANPDN